MQEKIEKKKYNLLLPVKIKDLLQEEADKEYTQVSVIITCLIVKYLKEKGRLPEEE